MLNNYQQVSFEPASEDNQSQINVFIKILILLCSAAPYSLYKDHADLIPITIQALEVRDTEV
jgi:hypothetical protein